MDEEEIDGAPTHSTSPDKSSTGIVYDDSQQQATERTRLVKVPPPSSPPPYTSTTSEVKLDEQHIVTRSYLVRWYVLLVYCLHMASNGLMWATTSPITDIVACYYGLSLWWINALSWISMLVYVVFFLPVARFVDAYGLRATAIVGGCLNAAGCWLRYAGTGPDLFWLLLVGQTLASLTNVFEWAAPSLLASVWFPPSERATASALLGALAPNVGMLVGLAVGPFWVQNPNTDYVCNSTFAVPHLSPAFLDWQEDIGSKLYYYLLGQAVFASLIALLGFFVPGAPPTPPSVSKHMETVETKISFFTSLCLLGKNCHFLSFMVVFSITIAVAGGYVSVVDEVLNSSGYEDYQVEIGYLGIVIQCCAMASMIFAGRWLDWTTAYYCTANTLTIGGTLMIAGFAVVVQFKLSFWLVCVMAGLTFLLISPFQAISYEYTVEMTYPIPEATSASVLNAFSQILSIPVINIVVLFIQLKIGVYSNWFLTAVMLLSAVIMVFIRPNLRRVKLDSSDDSRAGSSCWRLLSARRKGIKGSIQGY